MLAADNVEGCRTERRLQNCRQAAINFVSKSILTFFDFAEIFIVSEGVNSLQFKFQPNPSRGSTTAADDVKDRRAYCRLEFRRQTLIIFGRQKSNLRILWGS